MINNIYQLIYIQISYFKGLQVVEILYYVPLLTLKKEGVKREAKSVLIGV
jgi:hypothetical protein